MVHIRMIQVKSDEWFMTLVLSRPKWNGEGRDIMCEIIESYGDRREDRAMLQSIKNLMDSLKFTMDQAMDALKIAPEDRERYLEMLK